MILNRAMMVVGSILIVVAVVYVGRSEIKLSVYRAVNERLQNQVASLKAINAQNVVEFEHIRSINTANRQAYIAAILRISETAEQRRGEYIEAREHAVSVRRDLETILREQDISCSVRAAPVDANRMLEHAARQLPNG